MEKPIHSTNIRRLKHALTTLALLSGIAALPASAQTSSGGTNSQPPVPPSWSILEDADQDGMKDIDEILWGLDPLNPADGLSDLDGDGLSLAWEFYLGTNPNVADTDTDGWNDSEEYLLYGTNPLDPLSLRPRDGLDLDVASGAIDPPHGVRERDGDIPDGNELELPRLRHVVVAGTKFATPRASGFAVGPRDDFGNDAHRIARASQTDGMVNEALDAVDFVE